MNAPHTETPRAKPTVVDVAIAADVAVGTVSRVLNTPELVGADIRQRVIEAVERLDYRPLRRRRRRIDRSRQRASHRGNIGVLVLGTPETQVDTPVFAEAMRAMERLVASSSENLMRANVAVADRIPLFITRNLIDGLILRAPPAGELADCGNPDFVETVERLPHVWLVDRPDGSRGDHVGCDLEAASVLASEFLAKRGHRRVMFFDPNLGRTQAADLGQVFSLIGAKHGLSVEARQGVLVGNIRWPIPSRATKEQVQPIVDAWVEGRSGERATVIVVPGDDVAFQLYAAFHGRGVAVGRDIGIFSMRHERGLVAGLLPRLTSIDVLADEMGRRAVDQLRWRLDHSSDRAAVNILVRPKLVEGDSVVTLT